MLVLKACPRCHGDLMLEISRDADYYECLQCGHVLSLAQECLLGIPPTHAYRIVRGSSGVTRRSDSDRHIRSAYRRSPESAGNKAPAAAAAR